MVKSKTKIDKQAQKKSNPELVETIRHAKKNKAWLEVASILARSRRQRVETNLDSIGKEAKEGEIVIVPGKVLSNGEVKYKFKIAAFSFSDKAREKLKKAGCETLNILEEIKKNPEGKKLKIIK